jgi:hypothetical protein
MERFNELRRLISSIEEDAHKFYDKNNKAAGVRLRKGLQEIRVMSQEIRQDVSARNKESK